MAVTAFFLLWCLAASRWLLNELVVPYDAPNHFYSMLRFLAGRLHEGEVPLWNPYHFGGHPTIADPQSLLFTPSLAWLALTGPAPSIHAFDIAVLAHVLAGGTAVLALFRRRRWHPVGGLLAAMIYSFGGVASSRLQHTGIMVSYGLFPVAWVALEWALARPSIWRGLVFGAVAGLLALGRDQIAFYACLTLIAVYASWFLQSAGKSAWLRQRLVMTMAMLAAGAALLAVPALLTMQFVADSNRPAFPFGYASASSMHPMHLITLLFPDVFGNLARNIWYWGPSSTTIPGGPWNDGSTSYLGIGVIPGLLVLWFGLLGRWIFAREFRFLAVMLGLAVLFALGRYTPFFALVFDFLPGATLYRRPSDLLYFINFAMAFAAGYTLHRWLGEGQPAMFSGRGGLITAALALPLAAAIGLSLYGVYEFGGKANQLAYAGLELAIGMALAALAVVILTAARPRQRLAAAILLAGLASGELVWRNAASNLSGMPSSDYTALTGLSGGQQTGFELLQSELRQAHQRGERPRVEFLGLEQGWQNAPMAHAIDATGGYNALRISAYERAIGIGENAVDLLLRKFPNTFRGYTSHLARLLGVQYVVLVKPFSEMPRHVPRPRAELIHASDGMYIYRLAAPAPRVYLASGAKPAELESSLDNADLPDFDSRAEALIETADMPRLSAGLRQPALPGAPEAGSARIVSYRANSVRIETEAARPAILVLHDNYYPGWSVRVNGVKAPLLRANLLFRGVEVGAGKSLVEFRFQPLRLANLAGALRFVLNKRGESR